MVSLSTGVYRLSILITGNEIREFCTETTYKYSDILFEIREFYTETKYNPDILFEIDGIPIISSEDFKREVIEDKENKLYRFIIILSIEKNNLFYKVSSIESWSTWDIENVNLNLEALDLYRKILVDADMWNKIYHNPGKNWSDVYLELLNKC